MEVHRRRNAIVSQGAAEWDRARGFAAHTAPRDGSIIHGLARQCSILERPEHKMGAGKNTKGVMGRNRNNNSQQLVLFMPLFYFSIIK